MRLYEVIENPAYALPATEKISLRERIYTVEQWRRTYGKHNFKKIAIDNADIVLQQYIGGHPIEVITLTP